MAEPIDMLFGVVDLKETQIQSYLPCCANVPHGRAHWRQLVNTFEPPSAAAMRPDVKLL